jgi:hypothetical protein
LAGRARPAKKDPTEGQTGTRPDGGESVAVTAFAGDVSPGEHGAPVPTHGPDARATPSKGGLRESLRARSVSFGRWAWSSGYGVAAIAPLVGFLATVWLVLPTLAPSVGGWDTAEFQAVAYVLGTGHPTGYPSYVILGFIATHLMPFGEPAFRMNVVQALLAAFTVGCTIAIVQYLTGMRMVAVATGFALLAMPTSSAYEVTLPNGSDFGTTPVFWRLATHADYHMLHLALVALLFLLLLVWERWRIGDDPGRRRLADRWLVAAACVYGVAFANHGLAWLLPPAIALFVILVAPRIVLQWRLVLACAAVLAATIVALYAELPIRAAMNAPLVYGHPDSWSGFLYVVMGQQFGGSLVNPWGQLATKLSDTMNLLSAWLGPLGYLAAIGVATSLVRRPRFTLMAIFAAAVTAGFAASYVNADLERYFLVTVWAAFVFAGLGLADAITLVVWAASLAFSSLRVPRPVTSTGEALEPPDPPSSDDGGRDGGPLRGPQPEGGYALTDAAWWPVLLGLELVMAAAVVAASLTVTPVRQARSGSETGAVSLAGVSRDTWMRAMLAPADKGGLPPDSVIVSWWSDSTTLWYGQKVDGLRPDIFIVDDRTRLDDDLGSVFDVIDRYLGERPVFVDRLNGGSDGMKALNQVYDLSVYKLPDGSQIAQVMSRKG